MFGVRRIVLLFFVMAIVLLIFLIDAVVHLLAESAGMTEHASFALFTVTPKPSRTFFSVELTLLLRRGVLAALLRTARSIWEPLISGCFEGILLIVDEVPTLCEVSAEILNDRTTKVECYVGPSHAGALRPVEFVLLPMINSSEV